MKHQVIAKAAEVLVWCCGCIGFWMAGLHGTAVFAGVILGFEFAYLCGRFDKLLRAELDEQIQQQSGR